MQLNFANSEMSETEAIEKVKNGDLAGLETLYVLHRSLIYSLCLRCTKNVFDAEDLTQDVFLQVARKVNTFRGDSQFTSWLYSVALNVVRLHARQGRRRGQVIVANVTEGLLAAVPSRSFNLSQRIAVNQALSSLTPARRETVVLHDIKGLSHKEAAWRMGVTVIASKSRLHRARIALRAMLGNAPLAQQAT
jgi:RNA polymerase sigma-70 factor (ECF subfamily)